MTQKIVHIASNMFRLSIYLMAMLQCISVDWHIGIWGFIICRFGWKCICCMLINTTWRYISHTYAVDPNWFIGLQISSAVITDKLVLAYVSRYAPIWKLFFFLDYNLDKGAWDNIQASDPSNSLFSALVSFRQLNVLLNLLIIVNHATAWVNY